jgi:predicted nucleic acid-binding Zn ribbon protein
MIQHTVPRTCMSCGKAVKGRSDKKFCDDFCRNVYNNDLKSDSNNYVRNINNALRRNRRILIEFLPAGDEMAKTTREKLLHRGFQFKYSTHTYTNKKGNIYYFCYDYGYLPLENNWYLIVKSSKQRNSS